MIAAWTVSTIAIPADTWTPVLANAAANYFTLFEKAQRPLRFRTNKSDAGTEWPLAGGDIETCLAPFVVTSGPGVRATRYSVGDCFFYAYSDGQDAALVLKMVR